MKNKIIIALVTIVVAITGGGAYLYANATKVPTENSTVSQNGNSKKDGAHRSASEQNSSDKKLNENNYKGASDDIPEATNNTAKSDVVPKINTKTKEYKDASDNEYSQDGRNVNLKDKSITIKNKETNNKKVTITKPDIDEARNTLNEAQLPGNAYSDADIASLIVRAGNDSLDIVTEAKQGHTTE